MSILGTVVRVRPEHLAEVVGDLSRQEGMDIALNPGDGRLVVIIENTATTTAAQAMAAMALMPLVLNTSLVYEYSGPDLEELSPPLQEVQQFQSWRASLSDMADGLGKSLGSVSRT
jgi:nitrate reductase NapD